MPLKMGYKLAIFVSSIYRFFYKTDREAVKDNMRALFPDYNEKRLDSMVRELYINFGKYLIDFFRFSKIDNDYVKKYVKLEGIEHLTNALGGNKGVIAVTAHLGNWELGGVILPLLNIPFAAVVLNHRNKEINSFFIRQRQLTGAKVIPVGAGLRKCFSVLAENYVIALVGDRDYFGNGIEMDFLGKPTMVPRGPAVFSRRCGSPIVPCFMIRNEDDTFTFKFYEQINPVYTKDERRDLLEATKKTAAILEEVIRQYPTQWHVFRRFWEKINWERNSL
ncbi:MAG: lysophospholipid acyltransferase family protein [Candidatus Omnitrophota bacterium]